MVKKNRLETTLEHVSANELRPSDLTFIILITTIINILIFITFGLFFDTAEDTPVSNFEWLVLNIGYFYVLLGVNAVLLGTVAGTRIIWSYSYKKIRHLKYVQSSDVWIFFALSMLLVIFISIFDIESKITPKPLS